MASSCLRMLLAALPWPVLGGDREVVAVAFAWVGLQFGGVGVWYRLPQLGWSFVGEEMGWWLSCAGSAPASVESLLVEDGAGARGWGV